MKSAAERFPEVFALVVKDHEGLQEGHDIWHVRRVTHWGGFIYRAEWPNDERGTELAELACLCHNADRVLGGITRKQAVEGLIRQWLTPSNMTDQEEEIILNAVWVHDQRNHPGHSKMAMALRDADRLVNLALDLVIRSGQRFHDRPPVDYDCFFKKPPSFRDPATVMEDLALALEWVDPKNPFCMQTKIGMQMGLERAKALQWYFDTLKQQLEEDDIVFKNPS